MSSQALPLRSITGRNFKFPPRQRSRAAYWCERLAIFCVPFLIVIIIGHRMGTIETPAVFWLIGLAVFLLLAALVLGCIGFYELWTRGHEGGIKAARGIFLAIVLLAPFAWYAWLALSLPQLHEVTTDLSDPPSFDAAVDDRSDGMNVLNGYPEAQKAMQLEAYPRIAARRYNADIARVFREVFELVREREWTVLTQDTAPGLAAIDTEGSSLTAKPVIDENGLPLSIAIPASRPEPSAAARARARSTIVPAGEGRAPVQSLQSGTAGEDPPEDDERYLEAVATSRIFSFESDVLFRLVETGGQTLVDMRSASRWAKHDLGSNAARVIEFMNDLDAALQGVAGE